MNLSLTRLLLGLSFIVSSIFFVTAYHQSDNLKNSLIVFCGSFTLTAGCILLVPKFLFFVDMI